VVRTAVVACAVAAALCLPGAAPAGPLETGVWNEGSALGLQRIRATGARVVYMSISWRSIAPATRPATFDPANPLDPAYQWTALDGQVQAAVDAGLEPLVAISGAPAWAEGPGPGAPGTVRPDPRELGYFAKAAAARYSGSVRDLLRVRYWQAWAEQNLIFHLNPQRIDGRPFAPIWYRAMLNSFSAAVHSVHADNAVVTGGLAPFTTFTGKGRRWGLGPLEFMRVMLCMSKRLKPTCSARSHFDVWAHHPYTSGGPNHHAWGPDDVSIGDLPEMRRLLDAAVRNGRVASVRRVRFWVTEFSWDTRPPDPNGVPLREHARWVSEALYRMWQSGVSLVVWLQLRDHPMSLAVEQSGLYFRGRTIEQDRPKPALRAFRFPFVALPEKGRVVVWGRTPTSSRGAIVLERAFRGGWARIAVLRADRNGIFRRSFKAGVPAGVRVRATFAGEKSLVFTVRKTRDRPMYAFGTLPPGGP
jgi:hypothetical protein